MFGTRTYLVISSCFSLIEYGRSYHSMHVTDFLFLFKTLSYKTEKHIHSEEFKYIWSYRSKNEIWPRLLYL